MSLRQTADEKKYILAYETSEESIQNNQTGREKIPIHSESGFV
jgi:hypothetical protein